MSPETIMRDRRTYADSCGIARALDVAGDRWTLLIVRELLLGPKRFTDLREGLPNIGPDVLAQRLRELEQAGILGRRKLPPPAAARVYELTERGRELEPVLLTLGRWGSRVPLPDSASELSPDALVIALKTVFDPAAVGSTEATYAVRLSEQPFEVRVTAGRIDVSRGEPQGPVIEVDTDPRTLTALLWEGASPAQAIEAGKLRLRGPRRELSRFLGLFAIPAP
jgi:DNA-binding HxlR family transcriptional regulator